METDLEDIKHIAVPILRAAGVTRSAVFGSYVRGEQTERSDIDLLVDFPKDKSLFDFVGLGLELEDALDRKVDLVEFESIKPRLRDQILSEQRIIL
ncbi:MAG: nucleotidyltransferase family protein [Chloroflexota bacterium]